MKRLDLESVDSTSLEARRLIEAGAVGPMLVTARIQSAGRGRQGRIWASPAGNVYTSFILPMDSRAEWRRPWLAGFSVALAISDTVMSFTEYPAHVSLKWPNDTLIDGAKVAGLLVERAGQALIVGIGLNLAFHPSDTPYPATHLNLYRARPAHDAQVIDTLAVAVEARIEAWLEGGFNEVRDAYCRLSHRPGDLMTVRDEQGIPMTGRFVDIDTDGLLVIDTGRCCRSFSTGDVFPVRAFLD